ncbi:MULTISPECIES: cobalt-precorrin-4/precorrin-4 C(11)-methyltransferase [Methanoculleus]|uniref:Precorrin-4 C11-methyltransferase n=2 Tax=Methanoculleus TaxID=45989 RepID=A3CSU3_METMJ|nr:MULTISPECIES: cobalt-precorrin-4/precorrin-4 C(11)-methyltransferase [Methanoculleus]ABN56443.1 precorrin-4 C11-methyltransferase [Methanoculleus marisnigri JR1]UYU17887.1 cobalt-precorrin-4/precorrin-4 C(11)-methyltransferase [Methanoculleus submarinus]
MLKFSIVGAGPGAPDLITVRGMDLLRRADVLIYAGSLVNPALVEESGAGVRLDSWGMTLDEIVDAIEEHVRAGKLVVRLHSGDPALYGAIVEQMAELERRGIEAEIVPGVSSLFAAAAALKTQFTLRDVSESLIVTRPAGATLESDLIPELSRLGQTMVVFLGTERMEEILARVECPPDTPAAVVYHASWPDQKVVRGTVADIAQKARAAGIERTALIVIGRVVDPATSGFGRSVLYS